jgi:hypothetical protein
VKYAALIALLVAVTVAKEPIPESHNFVVRMSETELTLHPTAGPNNLSNCLLVFPDGRVHLQLRRQEFLDGHATVTSYEWSLAAEPLRELQLLLDAPAITKLKQFAQPMPPFPSYRFQAFTAEIPRPAGLHKVGYFAWQGKSPANPEEDKAAWHEASIALQPLVDWFHGAKSYKTSSWRQVKNTDDFCWEK